MVIPKESVITKSVQMNFIGEDTNYPETFRLAKKGEGRALELVIPIELECADENPRPLKPGGNTHIVYARFVRELTEDNVTDFKLVKKDGLDHLQIDGADGTTRFLDLNALRRKVRGVLQEYKTPSCKFWGIK